MLGNNLEKDCLKAYGGRIDGDHEFAVGRDGKSAYCELGTDCRASGSCITATSTAGVTAAVPVFGAFVSTNNGSNNNSDDDGNNEQRNSKFYPFACRLLFHFFIVRSLREERI